MLSKSAAEVNLISKGLKVTTLLWLSIINSLSLKAKSIRSFVTSSLCSTETYQRPKQLKQTNFWFTAFLHNNTPLSDTSLNPTIHNGQDSSALKTIIRLAVRVLICSLVINYINIETPLELINQILAGNIELTLF